MPETQLSDSAHYYHCATVILGKKYLEKLFLRGVWDYKNP